MAYGFDNVCYGVFADASFDAGLKVGQTVGSNVIIDAGTYVDGVSLFYTFDDSTTVVMPLLDCDLWGRGPSLVEWFDFGWMVLEPGIWLMVLAFCWRMTMIFCGRK